MREDIAGELGGKCEMVCGGDGHNNSLWSARIEGALRQAGMDVTVPQPEGGLRGAFHAAEITSGDIARPGTQPAPEPAAPAPRDAAPRAPGFS